MDVVVVMDGPETVVAERDTSFGIMLAAEERGHRVWHCTASALSLDTGTVWARAAAAILDEHGAAPLRLGPPTDLDLAEVDVVLVRTDPPFDAAYLRLTLLLDALAGRTLVVNAPRGLRDANEKLYACQFPDLVPATVVTADAGRLLAFAAEHGGAVVKPVDGHGGRGVFALWPGDRNAGSIVDTMTQRGRVQVVAQRFLEGVRDGDKRILLLDGEPLGAILRRPSEGEFRANICVGGAVELAALDERDHRIIERLAPALRADGLAFVGIDVIDGHLSEVNVTSPTGLRQLQRLAGTRPDFEVVTWLERAAADVLRRRGSEGRAAPRDRRSGP